MGFVNIPVEPSPPMPVVSGPVATATPPQPHPQTYPATTTPPQPIPAAAPLPPPPVVVDIDLDEIPDQQFTPRSYKLGGVFYTFQLHDDNLLTDLADFDRDGELNVDEMHRYFFTETFMSAVDAAGQPVPDGLNVLLAKLEEIDAHGRRTVSFHKRKTIVEDAVTAWADELQDTSMRPANRADRRRRAQRRR